VTREPAPDVRFEPLRPATRRRLIVGAVVGPALWLVALMAAAVVFEYSDAIGLGLAITLGSFVVALNVLLILHAGRRRQERKYASTR
jgi:hypothetical protein